MKRLMPSSLVSFLQNTSYRNVLKSDLFQIVLPTAQVLNVCEGQFHINVPSGTPGWTGTTTNFSANASGRWSRGAITSEASFDLEANTMSLICVAQPTTTYPGLNVSILNAARNGLFDAATVTVYTAYMPLGQYGNVSAGIETKFSGTITQIKDINRTKVEFECADPLYLLNMKVPTRLFQPDCPWSFGDGNCNPPGGAAAYTQDFTAATNSTVWVLYPATALPQAAGYFTQGVCTCTSGNNSGLSQTVKVHGSGTLTMMNPWLLPVMVGDTFAVIKGCDRTLTTCHATKTAAGVAADNSANFGGTPFVPTSDKAV
jgi:uncharacterized phage protein (TIGR02218 family)